MWRLHKRVTVVLERSANSQIHPLESFYITRLLICSQDQMLLDFTGCVTAFHVILSVFW